MDWGLLTQWAAIAVSLLALVTSLVGARSKAVKGDIEAVRTLVSTKADKAETADLFERMRHAEERISAMSNEIEHLPDKDTAHRMEMAIARLEGRLETMDERLKPVAAMATRMQDALLERNAK